MKERGTVSQTVLGFALSGTGLSVNQLSLCVCDQTRFAHICIWLFLKTIFPSLLLQQIKVQKNILTYGNLKLDRNNTNFTATGIYIRM